MGISPLKLPSQGVSFRFDPINSFPGKCESKVLSVESAKSAEFRVLNQQLLFHLSVEHSTSLEDVDKFIEALKKRIVSLCSR